MVEIDGALNPQPFALRTPVAEHVAHPLQARFLGHLPEGRAS
jgi:hypothetical protein